MPQCQEAGLLPSWHHLPWTWKVDSIALRVLCRELGYRDRFSDLGWVQQQAVRKWDRAGTDHPLVSWGFGIEWSAMVAT